ncbi:hypothetical protein [Mangrovihabitans endophyticus]|uniref:Integral membrane protein n=1 Tax=Mangrovihabitans endophyticus TaxID=1751298 RepID=A0A8J3C6N4_9ACTN|nr:hypothetical protein [Mangrovihabitans endophyticus]GGL16830.1 hypothetical protein GCM10012284_59230 [Mangrovihabitans endophyticus]
MPLQRYEDRTVDRPPGLIPPPVDVRGVTELRLHGVGGTTPENLLADDAPQLSWGDRIAGFFRTADRNGRHIEAYSWGGLTSRSASRVLWLLLFPFALANVAGWTCAPRVHASRVRFAIHRAVVRWASLGMTLNTLLLVAMTTMDIGAFQCGAQPDCVDHWWLRWLRFGSLAEHPAQRVLIGAVLPLLLIVVLAVLAGRSLIRYERAAPPRRRDDTLRDRAYRSTPARSGAGLADRDFWNGGRSVGDMALIHLGAALAFLAWLLQYTVHGLISRPGHEPHATAVGTAAAVLAVLALAVAAGAVAVPRVTGPVIAAALVGGALALIAAIGYAAAQAAVPEARPPGPLPGMLTAANWTYGLCLAAAIAVLPVHALLGGRRRGGFLMAPFSAMALAFVLLNGVGIGTMLRIADLLGNVPNPGSGFGPRPNPIVVPDTVFAVTPWLTAVPTVILAGFFAVEAVRLWHAGRHRRAAAVAAEYDEVPGPAAPSAWDRSIGMDEQDRLRALRGTSPLARGWDRLWRAVTRPGWACGVARARAMSGMARDVDKLLGVMAITALAVLCFFWIHLGLTGDVPRPWRWLQSISTWLAAAFPVAVLLLMRNGWSRLDSRRHLGVLWDIGTFWPRAYHPLAPPSYTERAVPDLQRRMWYAHDHQGAVVVTAHSQGTVLAAAALLQPDSRPGGEQVGLITFGSPLDKLYGWAFPAYFGPDVLADLRAKTWRWTNFFYPTDYIGGPVHAGDGVDVKLSDPVSTWYVYGQNPPAMGRHSAYWSDRRVWVVVDEAARDIAVPQAIPPERQRMASTEQPEPVTVPPA